MRNQSQGGMNKKVLIIGALILVLIIIFVVSRRGDDTGSTPAAETAELPAIEPVKEVSIGVEARTSWKTYQNDTYKYSVQYPDALHFFDQDANTEFTSTQSETGQQLDEGGTILWSNYENIDSITPENRPDDFYIYGMTVYRKNGSSIAEIARILGLDGEDVDKVNFNADGAKGVEYIARGIESTNFRVRILFQKGSNEYYVFHMAFVDGRVDVSEQFEKIAATLKFQ